MHRLLTQAAHRHPISVGMDEMSSYWLTKTPANAQSCSSLSVTPMTNNCLVTLGFCTAMYAELEVAQSTQWSLYVGIINGTTVQFTMMFDAYHQTRGVSDVQLGSWHLLGVRLKYDGSIQVLFDGSLVMTVNDVRISGSAITVLATTSFAMQVVEPSVQPALHVPAFLECSNAVRVARTLYCGGNLAVRTNKPAYQLDVDGTIRATSDVIVTSDSRHKCELRVIDRPLERVRALTGYTYSLRHDPTRRRTGLLAQQVANVLPEAVATDEQGTMSLAYGNMVGLLVEAIKELQAKLERSESALAAALSHSAA